MNETPNWHQEASSGSSKKTVSNWLNRLLPYLPSPCFQLEASCIDPVDLAEQGFPPTFFLDHGHFENLMKDTEPPGGRGYWGTHRQVMWELIRGSRIRQTAVREQPEKVLVGLVIAPEGTLIMSQLCQGIPADWVLWSSGVQVYPMKTTLKPNFIEEENEFLERQKSACSQYLA